VQLAGNPAPCRFAPGAGPGQHETFERAAWSPASPAPARWAGFGRQTRAVMAAEPERASRHDPQGLCLQRAGPPALRPGVGLRRPGLPALDRGTPGCRAAADWLPDAHRRPPDHPRPVQVVRPV